jgi:membrane-bound lytic murein transglycosylase MltF
MTRQNGPVRELKSWQYRLIGGLALLLSSVIVVGSGALVWWLIAGDRGERRDFAEVIHAYDPAILEESRGDDRLLTVLIPFDRTRFFLVEGEPKGFEYDLVNAFVAKMNKSRNKDEPELKLVFLPTPFSQMIPLLESGVGDMAAGGLTITPERLERVDFTEPYIANVREVAVIRRTDEEPREIDDLVGMTFYLAAGSSYVEHGKRLNASRAEAGLSTLSFVEADPSLMSEDLLEMVNAGIIEGTVVDHHIAELWQEVLPDIRITDIAVREGTEIAWAVPKEGAANASPRLRRKLDRFIEEARKGTLLGNILFKRYYENRSWIANPLSSNGLEQLAEYRSLLQRYGEQYGFDWRLLAALVFQESRFDPDAKSGQGAVGLMQVLPSTGKEVGFDNIRDPEANIHAGTKYLAFLRDRYFSDEAIAPHERDRLTLAAYNAGPARVRKLRERAQSMGRDPDRWFGHVERAAQVAIGDETVRYVANINKYRIAYGLSEAVLAERQQATQ